MSSRMDAPSSELPLELERLLDRICDGFEAAMQRGEDPSIESVIKDSPPEVHSRLEDELSRIVQEYKHNQRSWSHSTAESFRSVAPTEHDVFASISAEFQRAMEAGDSQSPEQFISAADSGMRYQLTKALLDMEMAFTSARGDQPELDAYVCRFPEYRRLVKCLYLNHFVPKRIGEFNVKKLIGEGSFGKVYLAMDAKLQRDVAIKLFRRDPDFPAPRSVLFEAQAAAQLNHEAVVTVFAVREDADGDEFIVLEFIDGPSLERAINEVRFSVDETARLMLTVASAVQHAHEAKLVHRDLKPANILLDQARHPRVTDFGLAVRISDISSLREFAGTLAYMAPEQINGESHLVDCRTDVWSMGVILYRMLTGRLPFQGANRDQIVTSIRVDEAQDITLCDPTIPAELARIAARCLAKRMGDRYQSAAELAGDLHAFLTESPQFEAATLTDRSTVAPKGLCSFDENDRDAFLSLVPGPRDRHGIPEKIRWWERQLGDQAFRVGLIYGKSGCGKSSLLRAGILPRLPAHIKKVVVEATPDSTESALLSELQRRFPAVGKQIGLPGVLSILREGLPLPAGEKLVVVIDQFEQWLHGWQPDELSSLVQALRQCDGTRVKALLCVRDDFWMLATRLFQQLDVTLTEGKNAVAVDMLDRRHAIKILSAFGRACGCLRTNSDPTREQRAFLDLAFESLAEDGRVIPVQLSILTEMVKSKPWVPDTLLELGGGRGLGVAFLSQTIDGESGSPPQRSFREPARRLLERLLPPPGMDLRGHSATFQELKRASELNDDETLDSLLKYLDRDLHLVTPVDRTSPVATQVEGMGNERRFQLTHDFLVAAVRDWIGQARRQTARGRAELRMAEYAAQFAAQPERRQLPSFLDWLSFVFLTRTDRRTSSEQRMFEAASRKYITAAAAVVVVAFLLCGAVYHRLNSARAEEVVNALATCESPELPKAVASTLAYRRWTGPAIASRISENGHPASQRLRLLLGAIVVQDSDVFVKDLATCLLAVDVPLALATLPILDRYNHLVALGPRMLEVASDDDAPVEHRLLAFAALARIDLRDQANRGTRADEITPLFVSVIARSPRHFDVWVDALEPAKGILKPPLLVACRDEEADDDYRLVATNILARFAYDDVDLLVENALDAEPRQFEIVAKALAGRHRPMRVRLETIAISDESSATTEDDKDRLARRKANAILLLRKADRVDLLWPVLKHREDPRLRAFIVDHFHQCPVPIDQWMLRLNTESDAGVRQALILLSAKSSMVSAERAQLVARLLTFHSDDPDAGVHGASAWALRQLGCGAQLAEVTKRLAVAGRRQGFGWYVTPSELTMIVIARPGPTKLGSPEAEPGRDSSDEAVRDFDIDWSFAVSATEVTQSQFLSLCPEHTHCKNENAPRPDCPANVITWVEAVRFCRKLSEADGVPESEMVVPPADSLKRSLYADFRTHSGYRLPIDAEWEFVCRAGTSTPRCFGYSPDLLSAYSCFLKNSAGQSMPVGSLLPNQWGAFDMLGNVAEWCYNAEGTRRREFWAPGYHPATRYAVRGNDFTSNGSRLRAANRGGEAPEELLIRQGFRIAHTIPTNN